MSPTLNQRELGIRLRQLRNAHGLTVEEVAERLLCSATKISRAETGARKPTLRDVRDLCVIYAADPETSAELMELARRVLERGWWQYNDREISPLITLEQDATAITSFGMSYVPALLQTEDYAREMIGRIAAQIGRGVVDQRVQAHMHRQRLLQRAKLPPYRALLDEAVLRRKVGGPSVIEAQLEKILRLVRTERVTVQVIPFEVGRYPAVDSNFDYLEFDGSSLPGVVYVEGLVSNLYLERMHQLDRYRELLDNLRNTALSPENSAEMIAEILR